MANRTVQDHVRRIVLRVLKEISHLLSGDASFPEYANYGQSLQTEWDEVGQLECEPDFELEGDWEEIAKNKFAEGQLYGGAQYFRALDEFRCATTAHEMSSVIHVKLLKETGTSSSPDESVSAASHCRLVLMVQSNA